MLERRVRRLLAGDEPAARARVRAFVQTEMEWMAIQNFVAPLRRQLAGITDRKATLTHRQAFTTRPRAN